mmetsp:Transcript_9139/g.15624  ORF Transcript_9139/g.15624 Transcript_9139/m.15624 type:complete len:130 (+) Transcript_9139:3-392(+)
MARIHDYILKSMESGYLTQMGEGGKTFAVSFKQRLSLVRALVRSPRILLLDGVDSDQDNEGLDAILEIIRSIQSLIPGILVIIASNNWKIVRQAQRVYVLDQERIKVEGTFEELAANSAEFRTLMDLGD